ncbi:hypothetical protein SSBR45G_44580 [Bradyrhizobium sp. SSBR45G]|uniref:DUF2946 family protein n=1 Tax=unclassified Bradyrhizobium TaxID=2631580 RepID=UPI002342B621|nr:MULTISPECIES: DUF2946 family protein [unclassified Bradyrhizobium]GLH79549.1 hypothetical protein SSBR45G_44580 [Bradyrhizobium sp. SSBR45G]GLH87055.1 hypothetical protein SSBR45R_45150 [Bradyrhizobium sp. SSBR45R]
MRRRRHSAGWARKAVSIAAAYLIALQVVLAGLMSAQMTAAAASDLGIICTESDGGAAHGTSTPKPALLHKDFCAVCAFAAHAAPVPAPAVETLVRRASALRLASFAAWAARDTRLREPRLSQGPPANA